MARGHTLSEIAAAVGGHVTGDPTRRITGVNALELAAPDQITWVGQEPLLRRLGGTKAGAVLIRPQWADQVPAGSAAILVERPGWAIIKVLEMFAEPVEAVRGVHPTAVVDPAAALETGVSVGPHVVVGARTEIGENTVLHAGVYVGPDARIGRDCVLWPNVVVRERCVLGDRVIVHPNATIGADGFGYEFIDGKHVKVPQIGNVEIADDVEIGANSCIDRAKFGSTRIGPGAKIDNLVQVAHNVEVGPGVILVAQVGLAGSAQVGAYSVLAGKAGVGDHVRIGRGARVAGGSCVVADVPDQAEVAGCMAFDARQWRRSQIALRRLPQLLEQVRQLARRVSEIESAKDHPEGS